MRISYRLHRPKDKTGKEKKQPVSILVEAYSKETGRIEIATGEKIIPANWDKKKERAKSTMTGYDRLNDHLIQIESDLIQLWRDNKTELAKFKDLMTIAVRGQAPQSQKKTLFEAFEKFLNQYKTEKEERTIGKYNATYSRLQDFDKISPIDFETLDFNFYDSFKRFLYGIPNPNYSGCSLYLSDTKDYWLISSDRGGEPIGLFDDTVYKYFINLKTFLGWAEKRGYKVNPSYKLWEIIKRKHKPISLTFAELQKLQEKELPAHLDLARDYLLLECYTGQRISDIKRFNQKDYHDFKWTHNPKKGNRLSSKQVTVHFVGYSQPALLILAKHNFRIPHVHEVTLNKNIKEACKMAEIDSLIYTDRWQGNKKIRITGRKYEFISTHTGRKTFITLALQHGMPIEMVMHLTGITEYQTISHYRAEFDENTVEKYLKEVSQNMSVLRKAN